MTTYPPRERTGPVAEDTQSSEPLPAYVESLSEVLPKTPALQRIRDYQLLEVVGRGGMGTVYKAQHLRLGKVRAVKVLAPQLLDNPEAVERFRLEIENCGRLGAPQHRSGAGCGRRKRHSVPGHGVCRRRGPGPHGCSASAAVRVASGPGRVCLASPGGRGIAPRPSALPRASRHQTVEPDVEPIGHRQDPRSGTGPIHRATPAGHPSDHDARSDGDLRLHGARAVERRQRGRHSGRYLQSGLHAVFSADGQTALCRRELPEPGEKATRPSTRAVPDVLSERPDVPPELSSVLQRMMAKLPEQRFGEPIEVARAVTPFAGSQTLRSDAGHAGRHRRAPHARPTDLHLPSSLTETNKIRRDVPAAAGTAGRASRLRSWLWAAAAAVLLAACGWMLSSLVRGPASPPSTGRFGRRSGLATGVERQVVVRRDALVHAVRPPSGGGSGRARGCHPGPGQGIGGLISTPISHASRNGSWSAVGRCRQRLSPRQNALLDALIAVSKEELDDRNLEKRLSASYQQFAAERGESATWSARGSVHAGRAGTQTGGAAQRSGAGRAGPVLVRRRGHAPGGIARAGIPTGIAVPGRLGLPLLHGLAGFPGCLRAF